MNRLIVNPASEKRFRIYSPGRPSPRNNGNNEEKKQIKEYYKSDREPGQESNKGADGKPEKKPWYKFWE
jgi:hypothetical protein